MLPSGVHFIECKEFLVKLFVFSFFGLGFFVCLVLVFDNEGKNSLSATKITEHNSHHLKETSFNNSVLLFSFN